MAKARKPNKQAGASKDEPRFAVAIMAAGKGTRLKSRHPKVLHEIGGKPLLEHVIAAAAKIVPVGDIYAIIGHEAERVREALQHTGVSFVVQKEQRGTGHAIMAAREALAGYDHFFVLSGDVPLISPETLRELRDFHLRHHAAMTLLVATPPDPTGYGRVIRKLKKGKPTEVVTAIVEQKALTPAQMKFREMNAGVYAFEGKTLFSHIDQLTTDNTHREFYLTDMAAILSRAGQHVVAVSTNDFNQVLGINNRSELARLDVLLRQRKCAELMDSGVTIYRPETCVIDSGVSVEPDTVIDPFVQLLGNTRIGTECRIRSYSVINNSHLGERVLVRPGSMIDESKIANGAIIGPYSNLRPGSEIGENAHVGNFVETKKAKLGRGSKANHLTYLGDATIGDGVNVGAGTITCNYDGVNKHQTVIEDGAFIGSDSTLVAPVKIGKGAYVGASSCITRDVPADALAIARGQQVIKEGWAREKREARAKKATS